MTVRRLVGACAVVLAVVLALTAVRVLTRDELVDQPTPRPTVTAPAEVALPPLLARSGAGPAPTTAGLTRVLATALRDPALGGSLAVSILDVSGGVPLLERRARTPVVPASTAKIVTAVAALTALDPQQRLVTRVVAGARPGEVVLVGAGDTTLAGPLERRRYPEVARIGDLATQVRSRLGSTALTRVVVDDRLYPGPRLGPGWRPEYVPDGDVAPISALSVDGGRVRPDQRPRILDPALAAGRALAAALRTSVPVVRGAAPAGATELASVASPPVSTLTEVMLTRSDNDLAESLARQVAIARGRPATFAGAAVAVREVVGPVVGDPLAIALVDGSGLSRLNRVQPGAVARLVATVAGTPAAVGTPGAVGPPGESRPPQASDRLAPVLSGLPVAGFDGTLFRRYRAGPAVAGAGVVRAKTGTLAGVSALAGLVTTDDGRLLAFDFTADRVPPDANRGAEAALDRLVAALASCGCR